jgi:hypothetical protein
VEPEDQIDRSLGARRRALPGIGWLLLNLGLFTLTLMAWVVLPGALAWIVGYAADEDLADLLGAWFYFTAIVLPAYGFVALVYLLVLALLARGSPRRRQRALALALSAPLSLLNLVAGLAAGGGAGSLLLASIPLAFALVLRLPAPATGAPVPVVERA